MGYDKALIAGKLRRWEKYLERFRLPAWDDIPDFGLYMEQTVQLLKQYLSYLPPELKQSQIITAATINNYVRTRVMPEPIKKKYYRQHIAYLIMICTLKQSLSIAMVQKLIPMGLSYEELRARYERYSQRHQVTAGYFVDQVRMAGAVLLNHEDRTELAVQNTDELIAASAIISGFARLLSEKLILLDGRDISDMRADEMAKTLAFVTTERTRIANLKCEDVVAVGRAPYTNWIGRMQDADREIVAWSLASVGMSDYARRTMDKMSDGECQRIMIARALAQQTPVILLDEPTSFLDLPNRYELCSLLARLAHDEGKCILFSTHELDIALSLADSIALIDPPQLVCLPTDEMRRSGCIERLFKNQCVSFDAAAVIKVRS